MPALPLHQNPGPTPRVTKLDETRAVIRCNEGYAESMSTQTITEFLEARVSEDEALAALVVQDAEGRNLATWEVDALEIGGSIPGPRMTARFSPARVLAECAAKRAIIELYRNGVMGEIFDGEKWTNPLAPLAAVYASHPDYREEWV